MQGLWALPGGPVALQLDHHVGRRERRTRLLTHPTRPPRKSSDLQRGLKQAARCSRSLGGGGPPTPDPAQLPLDPLDESRSPEENRAHQRRMESQAHAGAGPRRWPAGPEPTTALGAAASTPQGKLCRREPGNGRAPRRLPGAGLGQLATRQPGGRGRRRSRRLRRAVGGSLFTPPPPPTFTFRP